MANNDLYNYKAPKSGNEETGFFNIKGRINRKSFFLRYLFTLGLYSISTYLYLISFFGDYGTRTLIFFETIHIFVLPPFLITFDLIQGAKRMHDVNRSGWYFLLPLYNIYLIFSPGTKGNNDYGIDPTPLKNIQFFDELETSSIGKNQTPLSSEKKSGLDKWLEHVNHIRKQNPNKTYKEVLEEARNTYDSTSSKKKRMQQSPMKRG